jgi:DNA-binding transcriptional LysR family regulator
VQSAVEAGLGVSVLLDGNIRSDTMRVLGAADGLPEPPAADLGLFVRHAASTRKAAVDALQRFLCEELDLGLSDRPSRAARR